MSEYINYTIIILQNFIYKINLKKKLIFEKQKMLQFLLKLSAKLLL